jgi:hypothetical protein
MAAGRPTDYRDEYAEQAVKLAAMGATDAEIAAFFEVDVRTIYRWKHTREAFCQALKVGKDVADDRVARSLYQRAIGYEQEEVKIFMPAGAEDPVYAPFTAKIAPDTTAAIFWLKNRRPEEWRDRQAVDHTSSDGSMTPAPTVSAIDLINERLNAIAERSGKAGGTDAG